MEYYRRKSDGQKFKAYQWNGRCDDLSGVSDVGFDLQASEGNRTGQKPLIVYDPSRPFDRKKIRIGEYAVANLVTGELEIVNIDTLKQEFIPSDSTTIRNT